MRKNMKIFGFIVMFLFCITCSSKEKSAVALVEANVNKDVLNEYHLLLLGSNGKKIKIASLDNPINFIGCNSSEIVYADHKGNIWKYYIGSNHLKILMSESAFTAEEDYTGRVSLQSDGFVFLRNFSDSSGRYFRLERIPFDKKQETIFVGKGRAFALHKKSPDELVFLSDIGLGSFNLKEKKVSFDKDFLFREARFISNKYIFYMPDSGKNIDVIDRFNNKIYQHAIKNGFGVFSDVSYDESRMLIIVINTKDETNALEEFDIKSGQVNTLYKSKMIGAACYF